MTDSTTLDSTHLPSELEGSEAASTVYALVVAWSANEPSRVGEVLLAPTGDRAAPSIFGRGGRREDDDVERLLFVRHRPGGSERTEPIDNPFLSRKQLRLIAGPTGVLVENLGKRPMAIDGATTESGVVAEGGTLEIKGQLLFYCMRRTPVLPPLQNRSGKLFPFGEADEHGFVGESPVAWSLRDQVAFLAARSAHVLLLGESGSGKEVIAQAIHALSPRSRRKLVARNAATFPSGLIDAELFGNVANYPNHGMAERPGLVGEADGSTLFLDEIGELPEELQTHLLRVLDDKGEYQRLGESKRRTADVRLVAATNRTIDALKHDLAARLRLRLVMHGLNERREDIPLLVRHLLRRTAAGDPEIGKRFFEQWDGTSGEPRVSSVLMRALLTHRYTTHVRELDGLLWRSLSSSKTGVVEMTDVVRAELKAGPRAAPQTPTRDVSAEDIAASLERHAGVQERVWRELGLANRYVLKRLIRKFGITAAGSRDEDDD